MSLFAMFLEGLLSFFSPCVLPLIPLYMAYLSGDNKEIDNEGNIAYKKGRVFITTIFFVLGISLTFVILSLGSSFISAFIDDYSSIVSLMAGTVIIIISFHQMGIIRIDILEKEGRIPFLFDLSRINFIKAFLLGFVFSFSWTPCIGPLMANALMMSIKEGYIYLVVYALGLIIPFLLTGMFTASVLEFIRDKRKLLTGMFVISGVIMLMFGSYMIYSGSNEIINSKKINNTITDKTRFPDIDFIDMNNRKFNISDYKGKYVVVNFAATWCTYCNQEMPDYIEFGKESEYECIYVYSPKISSEGSRDYITEFLKYRGVDIKVIIDDEGILPYQLSINSFPTIYVVSPDGEYLGYVSGSVDKEMLYSIMERAEEIYNNK